MKYWSIIVLTLIAVPLSVYSVESFIPVDTLNSNIDPIIQIGKNTYDTAENTRFGIIAWITFFVSVFTLIVSIFTYISQKGTESNTSRLDKKSQKNIILSMAGHLYRNLVYLYSLKFLMEENNYTSYPSEELLEKMKIDTSVIKPYFYNNLSAENKIQYVNRTIEQITFLNIDIEVFCNQMKDASIAKSKKKDNIETLYDETLRMFLMMKNLLVFIIYFKKFKNRKKKYLWPISDIKEDMRQAVWLENFFTFNNKDIECRDDFPRVENDFLSDVDVISSDFVEKYNKSISYVLGKKKNGESLIQLIPINPELIEEE